MPQEQRKHSDRPKAAVKPQAFIDRVKGLSLPKTIIGGAILFAIAIFVWQLALRDALQDDPSNLVSSIATIDAPDIHSLAIDPGNPETIFFGSHAGIQVSQDGGYTWQLGSLRNADAMQLAVSPNDPETIYAVGHDVLEVSRDGGQSWQTLSPALPGTDIHAFAQDPAEPQQLFAFVVGFGVFSSEDGGTTWSQIPAPAGDGSPLALATNGQTLYAVMPQGISASSDQGLTWTSLARQPPGASISFAASASNPDTLYAGTLSGIARSTDGGQTWQTIGQTETPVLTLAVAASDPLRIVAVTQKGEVLRSDDGGETWKN